MIGLIKSSFYNEADTKKKIVRFVQESKKFSMGEECERFEKAFAQKQQRKFAVFVNSGSSANLILIQSLLNLGKLKRGDVIGVSALTWATNVMPLIQLGLKPYVLDCELDTLNVSPTTLSKNMSVLDGVFLTNTLGFSDKIEVIQKICKENGKILIEDNCESLGSRVNNKLLGNFSLASTFSTFVGHHISTIEGGLICTDDTDLYEMLLMTRSHGWLRNIEEKEKEKIRKRYRIRKDAFYDKYTFYVPSYNVRPTEINGLIGNIQIKYWDEIVRKRESNWKAISHTIETNPDLHTINTEHMDLVSSFAIPVIAKSKKLFQKYKSIFEQNDIEIRPVIAGNIAKQPFLRGYVDQSIACPTAQYIHEQGFYFGNNPELTEKEIQLFQKLLSP